MEIVYGKPIKGEITPLCEINESSGRVNIWGDVFKIESRDMRNNRGKIYSIFITDYTSSNVLKMVMNMDDIAPIERIKKGDTLVVAGEASFDKYDREVNIRGNHIARVKKQKRADKSEHKRVELHAHTKMSALDGLVTADDLIKTAAKFGHKAIAITDHGVAQAFPEAASAAKVFPGCVACCGG